jgi:molybdenum cofactor synthesis domain-containing protein
MSIIGSPLVVCPSLARLGPSVKVDRIAKLVRDAGIPAKWRAAPARPAGGKTMRIEILCTGDEILTGKTINTNYSHIARRLVELGLTVHWGTIVGDDRASLLAAFAEAALRADAVIVNGGLGPTVDDLSQEVAAEAAGVPLVLHEAWLARMEASTPAAAAPCRRTTASKPCCRRAPSSSTTRSAPPAASPSPSAARGSSSPPACRAR